ncbi:MAG: thiamine-phosphate kinase [Candidatus Eisenbacteria bacterium]|nr:thiamine-phosphate kinase [Candidatus Eisenbacteria bacterium]
MAEFDLIRRLRAAIGPPGRGTLVGPGDDAAVYESPGQFELLTCDAFVEGIHFRRDFATFSEIGAKCMVANVSDIAAMGGFPSRAVMSICIPPDMSDDDVAELYRGAIDVCARYGAEVVGGDTVGSLSGLVVSIALTGAVERDHIITRSGAVIGDAVVVTGALGGSETGLRAMAQGLPDEGGVPAARLRHNAPVPRLAEAQALIEVATPHAMIDVSDGLSSDVWHIAEESQVGIRLVAERIPIAACVTDVARRLDIDPLELALASGEEFELVATIPASEVERASEHVEAVTGTAVSWIGEVIGRSAGCTVMRRDGTEVSLQKAGYEHLK